MPASSTIPSCDELYTAEKGKGAFINDRRLRVAARKTLQDSVIATGIPHRGRGGHERFHGRMHSCHARGGRHPPHGRGRIDLAWTAAGRFDGYWEHGIKPWDMAAGILLVREAGGIGRPI